jgi:hypothetical protein
LRVEQGQVVDRAELILLLGEAEAGGGSVLGRRLGAQGISVGLQRPQRIGDILEGREHGAAVLRGRLLEGGHGGELLVLQGAGIE